jgi:hypothetical protein
LRTTPIGMTVIGSLIAAPDDSCNHTLVPGGAVPGTGVWECQTMRWVKLNQLPESSRRMASIP